MNDDTKLRKCVKPAGVTIVVGYQERQERIWRAELNLALKRWEIQQDFPHLNVIDNQAGYRQKGLNGMNGKYNGDTPA